MTAVEEYIQEEAEPIQSVLKKLRFFIFSATPQITEKLVYGIPFFYLKKRIFYLNPGDKSVDLGFCDGFLLAENPLLETKSRSQVKTISFKNLAEVEEDTLFPIIHEAILIQQKLLKKQSL